MNFFRHFEFIALVGLLIGPAFAFAQGGPESELPAAAQSADVIFLGEQHDNPAHHEAQANWVGALEPSALVFEMLTASQADGALQEHRADATALERALNWQGSGWPDFDMYYPIFAAAPQARIFGAAVPSDRVRGLMAKDIAEVAGELSDRFALKNPLPAGQQAEREALQMAAHCDALPAEMLPMMVNVQRLRDAALADAALLALSETGGPVVVITGNGHAREDWGAPFLLRQVAPDVPLFTVGQGEAGSTPGGGFGLVVDGPPVDRGDLCDAFRKG